MTLDPVSIGRVHNGLTGWSNGDWLTEITVSWFSNPSNFRGEAFNMFLFDLERFPWDEHWEICIFNTICFDQFIEKDLNLLPNRIGPWTKNVASRNIVVIDKSWFYNNFLIPAWEILIFFCLNTQKISFLFLFFFFFAFLLFLSSFFIFLLNFLELLK